MFHEWPYVKGQLQLGTLGPFSSAALGTLFNDKKGY